MKYDCYHWMKLLGAILFIPAILCWYFDLDLYAGITLSIAALLVLSGQVGQLMQDE